MEAFPPKIIDYNQHLTPYNDIPTDTTRVTPAKRREYELRSKGEPETQQVNIHI